MYQLSGFNYIQFLDFLVYIITFPIDILYDLHHLKQGSVEYIQRIVIVIHLKCLHFISIAIYIHKAGTADIACVVNDTRFTILYTGNIVKEKGLGDHCNAEKASKKMK